MAQHDDTQPAATADDRTETTGAGPGAWPNQSAQARTAEPPAAGPGAAELLAAAQSEVARLKDEYLRALAETENVRRRAARDRQDASQFAITGFARDLLPVVDNLRRALESVDAETRASNATIDALMSGVELTEKELLTVLERHGVKPVPTQGEIFNPHVHEALYEIPDPSVPHGTVVHVLQPGFTIQDRTLRPARVGTASGGPKPGAAKPAAQADNAEAVIDLAQRRQGDGYRSGEPGGEQAGSRVDETS